MNIMDPLKKPRIHLFALLALLAVLASACGGAQGPKPFDQNILSSIEFSFKDIDPDQGEVQGDILLKNVPSIDTASDYVIYWGSSPSKSGKLDVVGKVAIQQAGDPLQQIPANTPQVGDYFLLFLAAGEIEIYSGKSVAVQDYVKGVEKEAKVEQVQEKTVEIKVDQVRFDFDKSDIKPEFAAMLDEIFENLKDKENVALVISGHADERGSNEYNMALGKRRAYSVKRYLISLGLLDQKITVRSFGEEQPLDAGHNEEAWSKNRRAETKVQQTKP